MTLLLGYATSRRVQKRCVNLLAAGKMPYQRLGSHRRILFQDLMAFKERTDAARADAMRQLTGEAQELDMGY